MYVVFWGVETQTLRCWLPTRVRNRSREFLADRFSSFAGKRTHLYAVLVMQLVVLAGSKLLRVRSCRGSAGIASRRVSPSSFPVLSPAASIAPHLSCVSAAVCRFCSGSNKELPSAGLGTSHAHVPHLPFRPLLGLLQRSFFSSSAVLSSLVLQWWHWFLDAADPAVIALAGVAFPSSASGADSASSSLVPLVDAPRRLSAAPPAARRSNERGLATSFYLCTPAPFASIIHALLP